MGVFNSTGKKGPMFEGVNSVLGEHSTFKGEIVTGGSISVNGFFEGKIKADGEVLVLPSGMISGEIFGGSVVISGKVEGNIKASGNLEIAKTGKVRGELCGERIIIEEGASYNGKVTVNPGAKDEGLGDAMIETYSERKTPIFSN